MKMDFQGWKVQYIAMGRHTHTHTKDASTYHLCIYWNKSKYTLPETNSEFTPENWWLEDDPFLLGQVPGLFSGVNLLLVSGLWSLRCWIHCGAPWVHHLKTWKKRSDTSVPTCFLQHRWLKSHFFNTSPPRYYQDQCTSHCDGMFFCFFVGPGVQWVDHRIRIPCVSPIMETTTIIISCLESGPRTEKSKISKWKMLGAFLGEHLGKKMDENQPWKFETHHPNERVWKPVCLRHSWCAFPYPPFFCGSVACFKCFWYCSGESPTCGVKTHQIGVYEPKTS